jgi:hypothetical protein
LCNLANSVAVAVVLREGLSMNILDAFKEQFPFVFACDVALQTDTEDDMVIIPLFKEFDSGGIPQGVENSYHVGKDSAARAAVAFREMIVWHRNDPLPNYKDWNALLCTNEGDAGYLVTMPLLSGAALNEEHQTAIGALTVGLKERVDLDSACLLLSRFSFLLSQSISHNTKHLWEVSLAYLVQVLPPGLMRRMLKSTSTSRKSSSRSALSSPSLAPSSLTKETNNNLEENIIEGAETKGPASGEVDDSLPRDTMGAENSHDADDHVDNVFGSVDSNHFFMCRSRSLSLQFEEPLLELAFRNWFTASQSEVDRQVSRVFALMLVTSLIAIWMSGATGAIAALVTLQTGLGALVLPTIFALGLGNFYRRNRDAVVVTMRLFGTSLVLLHWSLYPQYYTRSWTKAFLGRAIGRIAFSSVRQKLLFSTHVFSLIGELYLCALFNSYHFANNQGDSNETLGLMWTSMLQFTAALLNGIMTLLLERRTRTLYLERFPS